MNATMGGKPGGCAAAQGVSQWAGDGTEARAPRTAKACWRRPRASDRRQFTPVSSSARPMC